MLGYLSLIVKSAHDFEGTPWLSYDAHFRCLAATMQMQVWSNPDQAVWSQYFGRATHRVLGSSPLSVGPYGEVAAEDRRDVRAPSQGGKATSRRKDRPSPYPKQPPICIRWNKEGCRAPECGFRHVCLDCHGPHREVQCPVQRGGGGNQAAKSNPPFRKESGPSAGGR